MSTKLTLEIPLARVKVHPGNPRHDAVADDQLVASVADSGITTPLLVAVDLSKHTAADVLAHCLGTRPLTVSGPWVIALDGHRRRDAAKKAKLKTVPVVIDLGLDSDVAQLRAMLLANTLREGLSPVEVAEAYQGMLDLGLKQADVAKIAGRKPRDVSAQLKVLKLAATTQKKVHAGVLTLDDAAGLVEFADDADVTKKLEAAAASGVDFRYHLQRARQRRDADQESAAKVAELEQAGVPQVDRVVFQEASWTEMRALNAVPGTNSDPPPVHDGCHGYFVTAATEWQPTQVVEICTDVAKHLTTAADDQAEVNAQRQADQHEWLRQRDEVAAAREAARNVRHDVVRDLAGQDLKISPPLEKLLRALLPALWFALENDGPMDTYEQLAEIPEATNTSRLPWGAARDTAAVDHLTLFAELSKASLGRHLVAGLAAYSEWAFSGVGEAEAVTCAVAAPYVDLLEAAGYEFAGPDAGLKAALDHPVEDETLAGPDDVEGASS